MNLKPYPINHQNKKIQWFNCLKQQNQIPGCLLIKIPNSSLKNTELKFFGVTKIGKEPLGKGVSAYQIKKDPQGNTLAQFNITHLIESGQLTDKTVECIITANNTELGRTKITNHPSIYLG